MQFEEVSIITVTMSSVYGEAKINQVSPGLQGDLCKIWGLSRQSLKALKAKIQIFSIFQPECIKHKHNFPKIEYLDQAILECSQTVFNLLKHLNLNSPACISTLISAHLLALQAFFLRKKLKRKNVNTFQHAYVKFCILFSLNIFTITKQLRAKS